MKKIYTIFITLTVLSALFCSCGKKEPISVDNETTTSSTTASTAATQEQTEKASETEKTEINNVSDSTKAKETFKSTLEKNKYYYDDSEAEPSNAEYALFDFDNDGIPELIIWDKPLGAMFDRDVTVYKYQTSTGSVEKIGKMYDFSGHTEYGISVDKKGIVASTRDNVPDTITKYTLKNGKIVSEILRTRENETAEEWISIYDSSDYFSKVLETSTENDLLNKAFK